MIPHVAKLTKFSDITTRMLVFAHQKPAHPALVKMGLRDDSTT